MDTSQDMICLDTLVPHETPKQQAFGSKIQPATPSTACTSSPSSSYSDTSFSANYVRVPMPSPSRPRLDPRYAVRLSSVSTHNDVDLMPPPSVHRSQTALFRPTPIMTPDTDSGGTEIFTPTRPPTKRVKPTNYGDRFIPTRSTTNFTFDLWDGVTQRSSRTKKNTSMNSNTESDTSDQSVRSNNNPDPSTPSAGGSSERNSTTTASQRNLSTFATATQQSLFSTLVRSEVLNENENPDRLTTGETGTTGTTRFRFGREDFHKNVFNPVSIVNSFNMTPIQSAAGERLITAPSKRKRRISKIPFKVLDAPALQDDFYLNLVDWSSQNVLAVGLGSCVYLWSACTSKVTKLCDLSADEDSVTAVSWAQRGTHLAIGTNRGEVQLWDAIKCKKIRCMSGHSQRVGTLSWTGPTLASGSRDRYIYLRDLRVQAPHTDKLTNHRQEVCGLRWSYEDPSFLASGGNDNHLHVIDSRNTHEPVHKFTEHTAAVKAIAWSPHQHGLLASGGGTADRCIRFWNTLSGSSLNKIDTGSQVCNLAWSQNCNEIVSTHGYSLNQIVVWRYPSMSKVTTLTGHTFRVLYLAMSPDGSTVVTGAGDETLRFWQIFPGPQSDGKDSSGGLLFPNTLGSVIR